MGRCGDTHFTVAAFPSTLHINSSKSVLVIRVRFDLYCHFSGNLLLLLLLLLFPLLLALALALEPPIQNGLCKAGRISSGLSRKGVVCLFRGVCF